MTRCDHRQPDSITWIPVCQQSGRLRQIVFACVLFSAAIDLAVADSDQDQAVLETCLAAIHVQARSQTSAKGEILHVLPTGPDSMPGWLPSVRPQIGDAWLTEAERDLRERSTSLEGWTSPATFAIPGIRIKHRALRARKPDYRQPLYFQFWPPGYDPSGHHALVVAIFGPAPHGAETACALERHDDHWRVIKQEVQSFL